MAAAEDSLSSELECAICSDQLKRPMFIGPCNHTFCKDCIDQLWASLEWKTTIPCPECRRKCPIPQNGADGLNSNFKLSNIIETFRKQQQKAPNLTEVKCTLCPNGASCFCKECDLKLCPDCKRQHDRKKRNHNIFGLCPSHGNGLLFFCNSCKQAVCGGCKISDHDEGDHDVTPIRPFIDKLISRIQTSSAELEDAIGTHVKELEKNLSMLQDIVHQKSTSAERQATVNVKTTIAEKRNEIRALSGEGQLIQIEIKALVKTKEAVDEMTKRIVKEVDKLEKENTKIIADVRERFRKPSQEINQRLQSLETSRKEMTTKLEQGRVVGSAKITIDIQSISYLTSLSQELMDLVNAARESDTTTVMEEVMRSMSELGLDVVDTEHDPAAMSGDPQIRQGKATRMILQKVCNVTFPRHRSPKNINRLKCLPDRRLAILGRTKTKYDCADTIYFYDENSSSLTDISIKKEVYPAGDMAVLSTGELVVARQKKPPVRVFRPVTGTYRDINITHDGRVINELGRVETDGSSSENMFVLTGFNGPLLVVNPDGNVIQSVQLRCIACSMAFCSLNRILYTAAGDRILRFHWSYNILKEISSFSHGLVGFRCYDVCIGNGGEVFVAGRMGNDDIVIYQVTKGEDGKNLVWREIKYQDGVTRTCTRGSTPHICINDDNLWLGYDDRIEKFKLD